MASPNASSISVSTSVSGGFSTNTFRSTVTRNISTNSHTFSNVSRTVARLSRTGIRHTTSWQLWPPQRCRSRKASLSSRGRMHNQRQRAIGFVFARGGSKGLPGKNIKPLAGKPLIGYAIETGFACKRLETVIVSTDDPQIAAVAREFGAETPFMRPAELASDTAAEWPSWQHAIRMVQPERGLFDVFVSLPATSPFRTVADIDACLDTLVGDAETDIVVTVREAMRSPYFSMVGLDESGFARLILEPPRQIERRQDAPAVYEMTTVAYVTRPSFVLNAN